MLNDLMINYTPALTAQHAQTILDEANDERPRRQVMPKLNPEASFLANASTMNHSAIFSICDELIGRSLDTIAYLGEGPKAITGQNVVETRVGNDEVHMNLAEVIMWLADRIDNDAMIMQAFSPEHDDVAELANGYRRSLLANLGRIVCHLVDVIGQIEIARYYELQARLGR